MNRYLIAGNWKMNTDINEAVTLSKGICEKQFKSNVNVVLGVPFTHIYSVNEIVQNTDVSVSAQNCYFMEKGAYTGEVSPVMLKSLGVSYTIVGHSERRQYFFETDDDINKKVKLLLKEGIIPIICVGETIEQREKGNYKDVIKNQLEKCLNEVNSIKNIVIAYEPVWAIGTGKTATSDEAEEVCMFIRTLLKEKYNKEAEEIFILYGGSMNKSNAKELLEKSNINGGLIGGASLKVDDFIEIINSCQ